MSDRQRRARSWLPGADPRPPGPARAGGAGARWCAAFAVAAVACLLALVAAPAAEATVWTTDSGTKVFPSTKARDNSTLQLHAAGDEYEGGQIALRGSAKRSVSLSWTAGSDALLIDNSALSRVGYVYVKRPSTGTGARKGNYPDPLLPKDFGQTMSVPSSTTSFYVLVHVPRGTPAGDYTGTIEVTEGSTITPVAVRLHVYGFDLPKERVPALFGLNQTNVKQSLRGSIPWTYDNQVKVLGAYYDFYKSYGFSPEPVLRSPGWTRRTARSPTRSASPTGSRAGSTTTRRTRASR